MFITCTVRWRRWSDADRGLSLLSDPFVLATRSHVKRAAGRKSIASEPGASHARLLSAIADLHLAIA